MPEIGQDECVAIARDVRPQVVLRHSLDLDVVDLHFGALPFLTSRTVLGISFSSFMGCFMAFFNH